MNCDEALLAISAALDGESSPAERARLSEHLLECESCRALAEDLRFLTGELGRSDREAPQPLAEAVRRAVAAEARAASPTPKKRPPYLRAAAAMLALCIGLGGIGLFAAGRMGMKGDSAGGAAPALSEAAPEARAYSEGALPEDAADASVAPEVPMETASLPGPDGDAPMPMPSEAPAGVMAVDGSGSNGETAPGAADFTGSETNKENAGLTADTGVSKEEITPADAPGSDRADGCAPGSGESGAAAPGGDAVLTPEEALELVFQHLGGYEAYPEARQRMVCMYGFDAPAYYLKTVETDAVSSEYCLDYTGSPPEGEGYYFRFYEMVTDKREDGFDHTATSNWYTVSPDGEITAEFPELPVE